MINNLNKNQCYSKKKTKIKIVLPSEHFIVNKKKIFDLLKIIQVFNCSNLFYFSQVLNYFIFLHNVAIVYGNKRYYFVQLQDLKVFENFRPKSDSQFMNEEFEIDADSDSYEKITVPDFDGGRSSRFIHDFNSVSSNHNIVLWPNISLFIIVNRVCGFMIYVLF